MPDVYRVEDWTGYGPYISLNSCDHLWGKSYLTDEDIRWPSPGLDGLSRKTDDYCGFASMRQFRNWFGGLEVILHKHGFYFVVYAVPQTAIKYGKKQVVFQKARSILIDTRSVLAVRKRS